MKLILLVAVLLTGCAATTCNPADDYYYCAINNTGQQFEYIGGQNGN